MVSDTLETRQRAIMDQNVTDILPLNTHESIAVPLLVYSVVLVLFGVVVVALRSYIRLFLVRNFGSDDIALCVTLVRFPNLSLVEDALTREPGVNDR